ncbi:MAG: FitA-like ribbon-helix-helix domain-containing protein [Methylobacter sp.]
MTVLTVHNLDDAIEKQLEINALKHHCSIEEEVCRILKQALLPAEKQKKLGSYLHQHIIAVNAGVELELPTRSLPRSAPDFF